MATFYQLQAQTFYLSGAGAVTGDTSIILQSLTDIDGNLIQMSDLGSKAYMTLEPGNSTLEEQISFTGITQNANGTATLTGVKSVAFKTPYTETSGLAKTHAGSTSAVLSNTAGFYTQFVHIDNAETIAGIKTFATGATPLITDQPTTNLQAANKLYVDTVAIAGAPDASTSTKGIVQIPTQAQVDAGTATGSTSAYLSVTPNLLRSKLLSDYIADTGSANAYAIAPTPALTAYTAGQILTFKAANSNTSTSTLNVSSLGTKNIYKNGVALVGGEIVANQLVMVQYDGTQFQILSAQFAGVSQNAAQIYALDSSVSANTITVTLNPAPTAYTTGMVVWVKVANTTTGATTINVNGLGAKTVKKLNGTTDITKGDLVAGAVQRFSYDGTNFQTEVQQQTASGVLSIAGNSGANAITTGFKPRIIRMTWLYKASNTSVASGLFIGGSGTWVNGTYSEIYTTQDNNSSSTANFSLHTSTSAIVSGQAASDQGAFSGAIGTLVDTGFTLTMSNATGSTPTVYINWEAQS